MSITDRLDEFQARSDAATDGPWITGGSVSGDDNIRFGTLNDPDAPSEPGVLLGEVAYEANAEFIAHARADVPRLVAALRAVLDVCNSTPEPYMPVRQAEIRDAIEAALGEAGQ